MNNNTKSNKSKVFALTAIIVSAISFGSQAENQETAIVEKATVEQGCGEIILHSRPPKTKNMHYAWINQIDGHTVSTKSTRFKLSAGTHRIKVIEQIQSNQFTRRRGEMMNAKYIDFEVKPNMKYSLGAEFVRKNRSKLKTGEYWNPVVWKSTETECKNETTA
ncbi:MAG: hypothetical protein ACPGTQ_05465 [Colwellia sp.]